MDSIWVLLEQSLSEPFLETAPWVVLTMLLYGWLDKRQYFSVGFTEKSPYRDVACCALLGAMPGCTGIMVVVKEYARKRVSFSALLAAMTATLGDASFLLFSRIPTTAIFILGSNMAAGWVLGGLYQRFGKPFTYQHEKKIDCMHTTKPPFVHAYVVFWYLWMLLVLCVLCLPESVFNQPRLLVVFGYIGTFMVLSAELFRSKQTKVSIMRFAYVLSPTINACNFILRWVIIGYAVVVLPMGIASLDIAQFLNAHVFMAPLFAAVIGLLPSCGPQVVVASLYAKDGISTAAQLANAISTNGDAVFPLFASAPRATLLATTLGFVYSLLVGYAYVLLEGV